MTTSGTTGSKHGRRAFPDGFVWGAATSAYQVEGAADADGRAPSVWDTFSHTPGKVRGGDTGDIACDFYNRSDEDLDLAAALGLGAFRFSVSWPRVQPAGRGAVNTRGLDFYRSLAERLRARGLEPAITLYHWDLPQALEDAGGWASRETAERFAEFAQIVAEAIDDPGALWITLNEPQVVAHQGYRIGTHAPGHSNEALAAAATHHLLLGHALAVARLDDALPASRVGISLDMHPIRTTGADLEEARAVLDAEQNRIFLEPLLYGRYPEAARPHLLPPESLIRDGDLELIAAPIDFLGLNYYSPHYLARVPSGLLADETPVAGMPGIVLHRPRRLPRTSMGWLVEPDGLYDLLLGLGSELPPGCPLYLTENGCASEDYVGPDGEVNDEERIAYLEGHLDAAWRAIEDGAPLAGYFCWSLLDNFEWAWGYQKRFGLVFVDFATQRRIPKRSARYYADVARANALEPVPARDQVELADVHG